MENCNHELVRVQECTKCGKTFDTIPPSADWEVLEKLEADTLRFMVVDLQSGIERMDVAQRTEREEWRSLEKQYAKAIRDLLAEVERLEEELKEQKRAAWNHEGVSKDYKLARQKVHKRDKQIEELARQRDILADGLRSLVNECKLIKGCPVNCRVCMRGNARQALADAGMEGTPHE